MDKVVSETEIDEPFMVRYYDSLPYGDKGDFLLVLRIVTNGTDDKWQKRIFTWRSYPLKRRLSGNDKQVLSLLVSNDHWRDTLKIIRKLIFTI